MAQASHDGLRAPHDGLRAPHDGLRAPHDGLRAPRDGHWARTNERSIAIGHVCLPAHTGPNSRWACERCSGGANEGQRSHAQPGPRIMGLCGRSDAWLRPAAPALALAWLCLALYGCLCMLSAMHHTHGSGLTPSLSPWLGSASPRRAAHACYRLVASGAWLRPRMTASGRHMTAFGHHTTA